MKFFYCKSCLIPSTRPRVQFNKEGVCNACVHHARKMREMDWAQRRKRLAELCDKFRRSDGWFDVIVPCSGGNRPKLGSACDPAWRPPPWAVWPRRSCHRQNRVPGSTPPLSRTHPGGNAGTPRRSGGRSSTPAQAWGQRRVRRPG